LTELRGDMAGRFADDLKLAFDRPTKPQISHETGLVRIFDEPHRLTRRLTRVPNVREIAAFRPHISQ
jgi:hypothetical protein